MKDAKKGARPNKSGPEGREAGSSPMVGQTVANYRVVELIGRGGMGTVYRATDDNLNRDVAIKVLNAGLQDPEIAKRFHAEAIAVARLNHPGIAMVYELFEHEGQWLMVMEFVRGETLEAVIGRTGPLSPERAGEVCLHVLGALAHAHSMGVVHRDLKPANLMITETGVVKVMDFGIARVTGTERLTSEGYMMGTPAYMAPEQVLGGEVDARTDLYTVGVAFYRLVTGRLPFVGETPFAVAQSQVNDVPTPIGLWRTDLPPWVDQVVARAMAKKPEDRFQSAAEFHEVLSRCLSDRTSPATYDPSALTELMVTPPYTIPAGTSRPPTETARAMLPSTPARRLTLTLIAVAVVLTAIAGVVWRSRAPSTSTADTTPVGGPVQGPARGSPGAIATDSSRGAGSRAAAAPASAPAAGRRAAAPATVPPSGGPAAHPAAADPVVFSDVKLLTVTGHRAQDQDVIVGLLADRIWVTSKAGGLPLQSLLYTRVLRATYVRAKIPRFDPAFPAPPADLDMPGLISTAHHWLALQAKDAYVILRLEDSNYVKILDSIQTRARVKVVKPR
jgi:serine/threonine-protein kinase